MNSSLKNNSLPIVNNHPPLCNGENSFEYVDTGCVAERLASQANHVLPTAQASSPTDPILLYPVNADRVISAPTTFDGKAFLKIAPGTASVRSKLSSAGGPEKAATPEFTYQSTVCLIEAVGRRWQLYGSRERAQLFHGVQQELESQGHCLPVERIRRKWNNLIVTYKRVKDRSRETGQTKTSWEYYEMMDALLGDTIGAQASGSTLATLVDVGKEIASASLGGIEKHSLLPRCSQIHSLNPSLPLQPATLNVTTTNPLSFCGARGRRGRLHTRQKLCQDLVGTGGVSCFMAREQSQVEEGATLLSDLTAIQEDRSQQEEARVRSREAREKRRERRQNRMADAVARMATALELLSSKQDTVIALLQRLADRK